jgi:single-stranded DNA-binding protein
MGKFKLSRDGWQTLNLPVILLLVCLLTGAVSAQKSADDYYHGASAMYIEGRMQQALIEVEEGLSRHPKDEKLGMLAEHLKKLRDQQKQENSQNKDKQKQQEGEDENKEEEKDPEEKEQPDSSAAENNNPPQDSTLDSTGTAAEPDSIPEGEMSEEEAKRLLESYKEDEKENLKKTRTRERKNTGIDW